MDQPREKANGVPTAPAMAHRTRWAQRLVVVFLALAVAALAFFNSEYYTPSVVRAVMREDIPALERAISAGGDINRRVRIFGAENLSGRSALMWASARTNLPAIRRLLAAGARTDIRDHVGRCAIHLLWDQGLKDDRIQCLEALLDAGANVNEVDHGGRTPLHVAVGWGDAEAVKELIARSADIDRTDWQGCTAIVDAVIYGRDPDVVRQLIAAGADVKNRLPNGRRIIEVIDELNVDESIKAMIRAADTTQ